MGEVLRNLARSAALLELVRGRSEPCFLCKWISQDLDTNEQITGWPLDWNKTPVFPIEGKLVHILLELDAPLPADPESVEDLASVVAHELEVRCQRN
jgi:hypothetical protein